ncbi:MAG: triple tyrosine motif-containing protein, partial [Bacteroidota bacterium]
MYKYLYVSFIDKYDRPWVNFVGRVYIFDPKTEEYEEVITAYPKECAELENGNIWCSTVNGVLEYSLSEKTKSPKVNYIINRSYPPELFPFLDSLKSNNQLIFTVDNQKLNSTSTTGFELKDSSTLVFFGIHNNEQTFEITQDGKTVWQSEDSLKTNTKSVPTRTISYSSISLPEGSYSLKSLGERTTWNPINNAANLNANVESAYSGISLFQVSPNQVQFFDSLMQEYQKKKFWPLPPFPNSQWLEQIEDSLFWYTNPQYGFQRVVLKNGAMIHREIIVDTIYYSGETRKWLAQHYFPLDKRYILLVGGNNIGRKTNGKILYPMAILDTKTELLIPVEHRVDKPSLFLNPGYGYIAYKIYRDTYDDFWMATSSHGLLKFRLPDNWRDKKKISLVLEHINLVETDKASRESNSHATDLTPDPFGNLWVSSHRNGVRSIENDNKSLTKLAYPNWINPAKFKAEIIEWGNSLWMDKDDKMWLSQAPNNLAWFEESSQRFKRTSTSNAKFSDTYRGIIYEDSQGYLWAFSKGKFLHRISRTTGKIDNIPFPEGPHLNKVFEDAKGQMWTVDLRCNFFKINSQTLKLTPVNIYNEESNVWRGDGLFNTLNDELGNTWISFHKGGLGKLYFERSPTGVDSLIFKEYIPDMRAMGMFLNQEGQLWIGHPDGLYLFDPTKEEIIKTLGGEDGFDGRWVRFLYIDKHNRIWFNKSNSLHFYDRNLKRSYSPKALSNLKSFESPISSSRGIINVATYDGIIKINTNTFQLDSDPPIVHIEKIISRGQDKENQLNLIYTENRSKQIDFPWSENSLEVQYTGIHYDDPLKNRFQYQLVGVDDDWVDAGLERTARYPNLPSGTYTFQVKAANANGFWSEAESFTFQILPPWWRTWWAYALYLFVLASLAFAFYRFQLNRQLAEAEANKFREIDEVKSRLYTNITHEFRTPLTIIDGLTDQIKGFDKLRHIIKRNTGQLLNLVNQLLDLAKMEEGKLSIDYIQADVIPFMHSIADTFNNVSEAKNIHFSVSSEPKELYMDFDKEKLQHIL